jgi:hypothetical protein
MKVCALKSVIRNHLVHDMKCCKNYLISFARRDRLGSIPYGTMSSRNIHHSPMVSHCVIGTWEFVFIAISQPDSVLAIRLVHNHLLIVRQSHIHDPATVQ